MQVEVSFRNIVVGALAAVGVLAIVSFVRDAAFGPALPEPPPVGVVPFSRFPERDQALREAHGFLSYVQCPSPLPAGVLHVEGAGGLEGPVEVVGGYAEFPVFAEAGEVTIRVPGYHREVARWSGLPDSSMAPCAPFPQWRERTPQRVAARLVTASGEAPTGAHVSACGQYLDADVNGGFAFEGGVVACTVQPFLQRPDSILLSAPVLYDPESDAPLADILFAPVAVRLSHWLGKAADLELQLGPDALVVTRAQTPVASGGTFTFAAIPGLPPGAMITAVNDVRCADVPQQDDLVGLAESLGKPNTTYSIILR